MRIMLDTNVLISMIIFPGKRFMQMLECITQNIPWFCLPL